MMNFYNAETNQADGPQLQCEFTVEDAELRSGKKRGNLGIQMLSVDHSLQGSYTKKIQSRKLVTAQTHAVEKIAQYRRKLSVHGNQFGPPIPYGFQDPRQAMKMFYGHVGRTVSTQIHSVEDISKVLKEGQQNGDHI